MNVEMRDVVCFVAVSGMEGTQSQKRIEALLRRININGHRIKGYCERRTDRSYYLEWYVEQVKGKI